MATDLARPAQNAGERGMLTGWPEHHPGILMWKCERPDRGATPAARRPAVHPSLPGSARHMDEVERGWFQQVFPGQDVPDLHDSSSDEDADFNDVDQADPAEAFNACEQERAASRQAVAQARAWMFSASRRLSRRPQPRSLRWIATHMIEEYARHNGHADLHRQHVDGSSGCY